MMRWLYFAAACLLLGTVSMLLAGYATTPGTVVLFLLWAVAVGVVSTWFVGFIDANQTEVRSEIDSMLVSSGALFLGWIGKLSIWPHNEHRLRDGVAVLLGAGTAWVIDALTSGTKAATCFICKQPAGNAAFTCPRCKQTICSRPDCWNSRHFRCRYCDEREVIIFPIEERWWQNRLGARVRDGSCSHCYKEAAEADLRACGQCKWSQCKRCWDYLNGQCSHCGWTLPDPPKELVPFLNADSARRAGAQAASRR